MILCCGIEKQGVQGYSNVQGYDDIKLWIGKYTNRVYLKISNTKVIVIAVKDADKIEAIGKLSNMDEYNLVDLNLIPFKGKVILEQE